MKKIFSAIIAIIIISSSVSAFEDIGESVYKNEIIELKQWNYLGDYGDVTFYPGETVSRGEAALLTAKLLYPFEEFNGITAKPIFTDIERGHYLGKVLTVLHANNIINGFEDGTFRPDDKITAAQMINMCVKMTGYSQYVGESTDKWYEGVIKTATEYGFVMDMNFDTEKTLTREKMAKLIHNTLNIPLVITTGWHMSESGEPVVETAIADGKNGTDFKSLLSVNTNISSSDVIKLLGKEKSEVFEALEINSDLAYNGLDIAKQWVYCGVPVTLRLIFRDNKLFSVIYKFDTYTQEAYQFSLETQKICELEFGKPTKKGITNKLDVGDKKHLEPSYFSEWTETDELWISEEIWLKAAESMNKELAFAVEIRNTEKDGTVVAEVETGLRFNKIREKGSVH